LERRSALGVVEAAPAPFVEEGELHSPGSRRSAVRRTFVNQKGFVLIRDEDVLIRELLERWLGEAGYSVSPFADERPCLVIADMPNPRRAPPLMQSLQQVYAAPILLLSGRFRRGLAGSAEAARRLGVKRVLPKPFTRDELLLAVAASLDDHG
jgi:CheY-like chemotaxis protein